MQPLSRNIAKIGNKRGPSAQEVIAGFGYIMGRAGLALYFKSRMRK
jgi:hypothetical protein